ncbi:MAG TPA: DUF1592 domain-containing protein, partial [Planctomycetia bacterium]|nr:DUF1592 domain-containing protein [Planctomycetia bacterium]
MSFTPRFAAPALLLMTVVAARAAGADFARDIKPLVAKYCNSCHSAKKKTADIILDRFDSKESVLKDQETWGKALENLKGGVMPPEDPKPTEKELHLLTSWIEETLASAPAPKTIDPGRVTLRRLNRAEYDNTVRDLLLVDLKPADEFPLDDSGYGFDNIGDALTLPPLLMEKYLTAAEKLIDAALARPDPKLSGPEVSRRFQGRELRTTEDPAQRPDRRQVRKLTKPGELYASFKFDKPGTYVLRARAYQEAAGDEPAKMTFRVDGKDFETVEVKALEKQPKRYETKVRLAAGERRLSVAYINDYWNEKAKEAKDRDRNLAVFYMEVEGPVDVSSGDEEQTESYKRIMIARPNGKNDEVAASRILRNFARRAFRRPATNAEVERLVGLYASARKSGEAFEGAIKVPLQAVLVSPHFLFRVEPDRKAQDGGAYALGDYELASRLSYFLWSSMPDDDLFTAASRGKLQDAAEIEAQVKRMIAHPDRKVNAFVRNFGGQWLQTRALATFQPAQDAYPKFDELLRSAMIRETEMFFKHLLVENRSIKEFLHADFTFVNERLARHYGIPGVYGKEFQKIALKDGARGGVLTQASVLTVTSNPTRTSPVKRGKWILENILNSPPPPPPPSVPELPDDHKAQTGGSLRQRLAAHVANPTCASCHKRMDPLGL